MRKGTRQVNGLVSAISAGLAERYDLRRPKAMKPESTPAKGEPILLAVCPRCGWPRVLLPNETETRCRNPNCGMKIDRAEFREWQRTLGQLR